MLDSITNSEAEGEGFEPSRPFQGALVSTEARPTVSGYLPFRVPELKWTAGESNPDFLVAGQVSSHWTSRPCRSTEVIPEGVEPPSPGCKPGALPLDQRTIADRWPGWESNPQTPVSHTGGFASLPTWPSNRVPGPGLEPGRRPHEGQPSACPPGSKA